MKRGERILILGGAGMVGLQVAREAARTIAPSEIIISALTRREVDEAIDHLREEAAREGWKVKFTPAPGDIFLPQSLQDKPRAELLRDRQDFEELFKDIFAPGADAYANSALRKVLKDFEPDVVIDCINTATAISYQDVYTTSRRVKVLIDRLEDQRKLGDHDTQQLIEGVRELMVAQGVPQITRHIVYLHRALEETSVKVYVKVGTTGTGGMGINIPYTHSEDRPSATLLSKSAIGFAHTGLLFLLARTPPSHQDHGSAESTIIKEIKPGAMIGFRRLGRGHVRLPGPGGRREPAYLIEPKEQPLSKALDPMEPWDQYRRFGAGEEPLTIIGADTGENGFFSIGEFQAITYPRQMEYVTPEEVARTVVLEILGSSTGRDVIAAIDGAITEPSYRAGVLRDRAVEQMLEIEKSVRSSEDILPSVAIGHLGPPRLSKLLYEAWLLQAALETKDVARLIEVSADEMQKRVEAHLQANPRIVSLIVTIGLGIVREKGGKTTLTRGPRLNIPVQAADGNPIALDQAAIERYAYLGWVDLRRENFERWHERIARISQSRPNIVEFGSAAYDQSKYMPREFQPGDVVGWLLTNETDEMGLPLHRIL